MEVPARFLETLEGWYKISSGEVEGYTSAEYILTGDEAKTAAKDLVKERVYITADNLNIRETPSMDGNIVGKCLQGELHELLRGDRWLVSDLRRLYLCGLRGKTVLYERGKQAGYEGDGLKLL